VTDYPRWREALATANDPAFWPIEAIDELLSHNKAHFWGTDKAALVTTINFYPGGAIAIEALAGAGDLSDLIEVIAPRVEHAARMVGATHLKIPGRRGWTRAMKSRGWRHFQDIVIKDLVDGQL
jgi:hypothetical protein